MRVLALMLAVGLASASEVPEDEISKLVQQLGAEAYDARERAVAELKEIGIPAKQAVAEATQSRSPEVRIRARAVLRAIRVRELRQGIDPDRRELHIVGCYEGEVDGGRRRGSHPQGRVEVIVDRPGVAVTLVLTAYEPVRWQVRPAEGSFVERVILSGYHPQEVAATPALEATTIEQGLGRYAKIFAYKPGRRFDRVVAAATKQTDLEPASFTGKYRLGDEAVRVEATDPP